MLHRIVEGLAFMAGGYAAVSAWVIGFYTRSASLTANDLIIGIGVALLAYGFGTAYERTHGLSWVTPLLGVWLIIAPWVVHDVTRTNGLLISNIVVGACIVVLGLGTVTMGMRQARGRR